MFWGNRNLPMHESNLQLRIMKNNQQFICWTKSSCRCSMELFTDERQGETFLMKLRILLRILSFSFGTIRILAVPKSKETLQGCFSSDAKDDALNWIIIKPENLVQRQNKKCGYDVRKKSDVRKIWLKRKLVILERNQFILFSLFSLVLNLYS